MTAELWLAWDAHARSRQSTRVVSRAGQRAEAADTLDGPWDDVTLGLDGNLAFLKGDRLLELKFATSSTDEAGAMTLAWIALGRLAAAPGMRP